MKRLIFILFCFMVVALMSGNTNQVVIPKNSIRYRIIASSDDDEDQKLKWTINSQVLPKLSEIVSDSQTKEEASNNIKQNMGNIKNIVNSNTSDYQISYGNNYFPEKKYQDIKYEEGNYESLVIKLGSGKGNNFWCVVFPPLCLLEADKTASQDVNYSLYIKKIINKYI